MYYEGCLVQRDAYAAVRYYKMAAKQRHAAACNNLGLCYETGTGIDKVGCGS